MSYKFALISGDKRNVYLAEKLKKNGHEVFYYGFDKNEIDDTYKLDDAIKNSDYVICAIPFTRDGISLNTPLSNNKILINDFLSIVGTEKPIFTGAIDKNYQNIPNLIDVYKCEKVQTESTISTAEGAIKIAIENTDISLNSSNILVIGYGKIGSYLSKCLKSLGANVTVISRSDKTINKASDDGFCAYSNLELDKNLSDKKIIFNTAEKVQIDSKNLHIIDKDTIYIELASKPFGINYEDSVNSNLKVLYGLSLPGIVSPETISSVIYDEIFENIKSFENNLLNYKKIKELKKWI